MTTRFNEAAEQELREAYIESSGGTSGRIRQVRSHIRRSCLAFREELPADSLLNHTYTTEWVAGWSARQSGCSLTTRQDRLMVLGSWWQWLFEHRVIEDNVLDAVSCMQLARHATPRLTLRCNLQRHIADYLDSRPVLAARTRADYESWLTRFNIFVNSSPDLPRTVDPQLALGEQGLAAWFRAVCNASPRQAVSQVAGLLRAFSDFLVAKGVLPDNPLSRLERAYPVGKLVGVAFALAANDPAAALEALAPPPRFRSHLADRMAGYLELKRALGCDERNMLWILRDFDRFLVKHGEQGPITSGQLSRWHASRPDLEPTTRRLRWIVIRHFCLYVQRYVPTTYVPDSLVGRLRPSTFRPHIVLPDQMKVLMDALPAICGGSRWPLRRHIFQTLLVLLYTTGLRISEALLLRVDDVDLHDRVLLVRETKFCKSRLVPFSDGLLAILQHYQQERLPLLGSPARAAPFFPAAHGGHYARRHVEDVWLKLRRHVDIDGGSAGPRIHDLRHSFATLRLTAWYREGADVEAKLPILATYMGHASVAATYRYLTILPETLVAASERFRHYSGTIITPAGGHHALA